MRQGKPQPGQGVAKRRRASSDTPREGTPDGEAKQPYASEVNDYTGGKVKPPKESPTTADG